MLPLLYIISRHRTLELDLKKTTVRKFKKEYLAELKKRKCEEVSEPVMECLQKKRETYLVNKADGEGIESVHICFTPK